MIKPPHWKKDAVPSRTGWKHPRTGELLKSQRITQEEINEYNRATSSGTTVGTGTVIPVVAPKPVIAPAAQSVHQMQPTQNTAEAKVDDSGIVVGSGSVVPTATVETNELADISDEIAEMRRRTTEALKTNFLN